MEIKFRDYIDVLELLIMNLIINKERNELLVSVISGL